jgi:hypothetical protein
MADVVARSGFDAERRCSHEDVHSEKGVVGVVGVVVTL